MKILGILLVLVVSLPVMAKKRVVEPEPWELPYETSLASIQEQQRILQDQTRLDRPLVVGQDVLFRKERNSYPVNCTVRNVDTTGRGEIACGSYGERFLVSPSDVEVKITQDAYFKIDDQVRFINEGVYKTCVMRGMGIRGTYLIACGSYGEMYSAPLSSMSKIL
jgi:hypothetical protein